MKKKMNNLSTLILLLVGVLLICVSLAMLIPNLLNYKKSNDTYDTLNEEYVTVPDVTAEVVMNEEDDTWWYEDVKVHVGAMQQVNSDIIGWIRFDKMDQLSYPVLYSGDDEK